MRQGPALQASQQILMAGLRLQLTFLRRRSFLDRLLLHLAGFLQAGGIGCRQLLDSLSARNHLSIGLGPRGGNLLDDGGVGLHRFCSSGYICLNGLRFTDAIEAGDQTIGIAGSLFGLPAQPARQVGEKFRQPLETAQAHHQGGQRGGFLRAAAETGDRL